MPLLRNAAGKPITLAEEIGIGSIVLAGDRRRRPAPRRQIVQAEVEDLFAAELAEAG